MSETTDSPAKTAARLAPVVQQFVLRWGNLGERWGVNRSVAQIHALLYVADKPLTAEEIADALGIARSNVSNSIRELMTWDLIRTVPMLRDRRTFYAAETDLWTLVSRIAAGRKARELDPAAAALKECVEAAQNDREVSPTAVRRLREMLDFVERTSRWYDQMIRLPRSQITALMKLGAGVVRLLDRGGSKRSGETAAAR